jgi:chromosome segregation protein
MFADRIEVPEALTAALTGLLGDQLQYVIVSDPARGVELLDELRAAERGRAHVVAARPFYVAGASRRSPAGATAVGHLAELLRYEPADEPLVRSLVGDAIVVHSAQDALDLVSSSPGTTAVALDGTVVRPNGVVSGGSGDDVASAMIEQKREMRVLAADVERLTADEHREVTARNAIRARQTEVGTALDRARQGAHEGEVAHIRAEKDLVRTRSELDTAQKRHLALGAEAQELDEMLRSTALADTEVREQLCAIRTQLEHLEHDLTRAEVRAAERKDRADSQAVLVADRRVRLAQIREKLESSRTMLGRVLADVGAKQSRVESLDQGLLEAAAAFGETAGHLVVATEAREVASEAARAAHQRHREAEALRDQIRNALGVREAELRELREQVAAFDEAAHHHQMQLQRIESDHEHLLKDISRRFRGLQLARVVGDYHARPQPDAEHRRRIEELTQLIDRIGPVNLDARTEYEESERRFTSLSQQHRDIEQALADLERAIKHMNRESRRRFKETFEAVNELFKQTFTRLFRGGRAELRLTNPEDLLETGVDIIAQPPGKKLGNIELMSGGEKALTAVALIFAIFQHKPSPFCILDEVDAPLDDANVTRYNEAIRSMTDRSQFILITHIKTTMKAVDVLYGVTMGEPGVSRVVSVQINESAQQRSGSRAPAAEPRGAEFEATQVA